MKANVHPQWYPKAKVICACGHSFFTGSTQEKIKVEICSACHPFFTGQQKFIDTLGRVEKFQEKQKKAAQKVVSKRQKKLQKRAKLYPKEKEPPKTLKEMLSQK
ncbi:MAG TPA: 50S ribosomal protein L31 [Clostridia bacterium]|nr:50S ribosomal protein L31 [Clostridia bacterium]